MAITDYSNRLQALEQDAHLLICDYCGVETLSIGDIGICSNCECIITTSKQNLEGTDHLLLGSLNSILENTAKSNYGAVVETYNGLIAERKLPQFLYAAALSHIKYSNHEITLINYLKPGFMDDNTVHRNNAAKLASSAKKLLTKAIKMAKDELAESKGSMNLQYTLFLAQLKMNMLRASKSSLDELKKLASDTTQGINNEYVYNYASMIFEAKREKYDSVTKIAKSLMLRESFSINAYYYTALAFFKERKLADAKALLDLLNNKISRNESLEALSFEVDYQIST
ncbi:MAG: hypothetical protein ABR981_03070 [Candidatus Micrarchaeaceae archaeon]|jgi:hypothetical protein